MKQKSRGPIVALVACACALAAATPVAAQAWNYPTFQNPNIVTREFGGGVATAGDAGTTLVGQWRERLGPLVDLSVDLGFASPKGNADTRFLLGGGLGYQIVQVRPDLPFEVMLTGGGYVSTGNSATIFRVPLGASMGRRFPLQGQLAVTPYVHPRVSLDFCNGDNCGNNSEINIGFDLGGDLEVTREFSLRASLGFGGILDSNDPIFGFGFGYRPARVTRPY